MKSSHVAGAIAAVVMLSVVPAARADDVYVHTTGDSMTLEMETREGWSPVCKSPCDTLLSQSGVYRANAAGDSAQLACAPGDSSAGGPLWSEADRGSA